MRDQFDDLEFEIEDEPLRDHRGGRARRDWSSKRVPIAVGALALIVVAAALASRNDTKHTSTPRTTATARTTSPTPRTTATTIDDTPTTQAPAESTVETTAAPTTTSSLYSRTAGNGPLLPTKTGTVVIARTYEGLSIVDLDTGDIERIALPTQFSPSAPLVTASPDWIIERSGGGGSGNIVRGSDPPVVTPLPDSLRPTGFGAMYPGPQANLVWVTSTKNNGSGSLTTLALVDLDSGASTRQVNLDNNLTPAAPDGSGEVYLEGVGGIYVTEGDSLRRVSTGALIAAGHGTLVVVECDEHHTCERVVTSVASGTRRVIPSPLSSNANVGGFGTVSPDGGHAVTFELSSTVELRLIDLQSGEESALGQLSTDTPFFFGAGGEMWTAGGRYILWVRPNNKAIAYDVTTGTSIPLDAALGSVLQLTTRPSSSGQ